MQFTEQQLNEEMDSTPLDADDVVIYLILFVSHLQVLRAHNTTRKRVLRNRIPLSKPNRQLFVRGRTHIKRYK